MSDPVSTFGAPQPRDPLLADQWTPPPECPDVDETTVEFTQPYEAQVVQVRYSRPFRNHRRGATGPLDEDQAYELGLAGIVEVLG